MALENGVKKITVYGDTAVGGETLGGERAKKKSLRSLRSFASLRETTERVSPEPFVPYPVASSAYPVEPVCLPSY